MLRSYQAQLRLDFENCATMHQMILPFRRRLVSLRLIKSVYRILSRLLMVPGLWLSQPFPPSSVLVKFSGTASHVGFSRGGHLSTSLIICKNSASPPTRLPRRVRFPGTELIRRLEQWGLDSRFVTVLPDKQTGVVRAHIQPDGSAKYEIVEDVAWDWIEPQDEVLQMAERGASLLFETLAQRSEHNRKRLDALLEKMSGG